MPLTPTLLPLADAGARAAYAALWEGSPQRSPFAHLAFADAITATFGLAGHLAAVLDDEGRWRAAALVFEKKRGPVRASALPPLAPYHAPLLDGPPDDAEVHARRAPLDVLLGDLGARFAQASLALPPDFDARPLDWAGWRLTARATYLSALPEGADPAAWSSATRRTARKATGDFRVEEGPHHVGAAARLMVESYRRKDAPFGIEAAAVERVARALVEVGLARAFAAVPAGGGEAEAAVVAAHDGRTAYYWIAGSRPGPAMTVLLAGALPRLAADGVATFDWCGANTPSVAEFKRRFGPALAPAVQARRIGPAWLRLLDAWRGG